MSDVKKIGVAVIACGARSKCVVNHLLQDSENNVEILSVYDPIDSAADAAFERWKIDPSKCKKCSSYMEAINTPGVDWVMVFSPNAFHKEHILAAFKAGKHVFSEKPLATSIDDCQEIYEAHKKTNLFFATGFVLRYAPIYQKIKEFLDSGKFGKLLSIEANENVTPSHGGYIMRNWRRKTELAGPHILEKCCHDLDLINWFVGSLPSKVFFTGTKNVFMAKNRFMEEKFGLDAFNMWGGHDQIETAFNDDNDLMDTTCGTAIFRNGVQVSFCASMCNAIPERRMRFNCSEGTIILELYEKTIKYRTIGEEELHVLSYGVDGHGGGDSHIMKELYTTMTQGVTPKCSGNEGLASAVFALAFDQSAREGKIVDLEETWQKLKR
jgi:predicted dehydrogenase